MRSALDLFRFNGRVTRGEYLGFGVLLFAIKYGLDSLISHAFKMPWNPLMYVSPRVSPLAFASENSSYVLTLLCCALPFIWAGVSLSARRLEDMGVHRFWAGLFLLPFVHFAFFLALAVAPSHAEPAKESEVGPYRESALRLPRLQPRRLFDWFIPQQFAKAYFLSLVANMAVGLFSFVIAVQVNQAFGSGLFIGAPFGMGFATGYILSYHQRIGGWARIGYGALNLFITLILLIATGWEGLACVFMAFPILLLMAGLGAALGSVSAQLYQLDKVAPLLLLGLFGFIGWDAGRPLPPSARSVVSRVTISAPIETVWHNVVAFPPIDEPPKAIFAIVGMPIEARIEGKDPGALRRCIFTNGEFEEPVQVWNEPRELTFGVRSQPKYLDEYLSITKGQFLLTANPDGTTTIQGTTWYEMRLHPLPYWTAWGEMLLHQIHLRVLEHIQHLSEHPPATATASAPLPDWMASAHATCACTRHPPK